ncbi:phage tail protein [Pseudoalteromonas xiamenensis]|uniref:phage tail-collar fiber domain-containing protein n=1 Tax=Pseudoalteromonas xiamenensis TaxID=882626 RepID=UPI0027E4D632|nr:phage tail protein [Pseudoalteromonas xiamenensis]WMN59278.1 phage tail protein [Pseudoalteromonas xiamenensis]
MTSQLTYLPVVWTHHGLDKLVSNASHGIAMPITHVSAGEASYTPEPTQTALRQEHQKVPVSQAEALGNGQLRFSALFDGPQSYAVREVGLWADETLVAIYSMPELQINFKAANAAWIEVFTLNVGALPTQNITFTTGMNNVNVLFAKEMALMTEAQMNQGKTLIEHAALTMKMSHQLASLMTQSER